jgi:hypothetical protein
MAVYQSCSIKSTIATIISLTGVKDTNFVFMFDSWIPMAMGILKTKFTLSNKWADVPIHFHKGELPNDLRVPKAVEYCGHRLAKGNSVETVGIPPSPQKKRNRLGTTNGFEYVPQFYNTPVQPGDNPGDDTIIYTQDLVSLSADHCNGLPGCSHWYDTELGYITSSIEEGILRVHYRAIPVDEDGLPLIPDNENYKMALYYYCRAMMIGAGWEDKVFTYDKLMGFEGQRKGYFWQHAERALGEIRYPAVDAMEYKVNEWTRLIKDENYFNNFFSSSHPERKYGYDEYLYNVASGDAKTYLNFNKSEPQ